MRPRTAGRRLAFQYLFMADLLDHDGVETPERFLRTQREAVRDAAGGGAAGVTWIVSSMSSCAWP